jgi:hypothetical protein
MASHAARGTRADYDCIPTGGILTVADVALTANVRLFSTDSYGP